MPSDLSTLFSRRMLLTFFLGFSSGMPLIATGGTLKAWMRTEHIDLRLIGAYSLVGLPYTLKFLWAPLMDRFAPRRFGRRRGWMLITQFSLMITLALLGSVSPAANPQLVAFMAVLVSFCSASQDIVLDAHRRDILKEEELGLGSALFINGYRIGMLVSGAFALYLASFIPWSAVYQFLAGCMGVGIVATLLAPEPEREGPPPRTIREAVILPLKDYFSREGAFLFLAFILLYKLGDTLADSLFNPFYLDAGFTLEQIAAIAKTFGLVAAICGGLIGGWVILKIGINRSLWIFGVLQIISVASFAVLAAQGNNIPLLAFVVSFESLSAGMGTSAYAAFMAALCNKRFSATQYALLSSLMGIPRVIFSSFTGALAEQMGWTMYFIFCALTAVPGMLLLRKVAPWGK